MELRTSPIAGIARHARSTLRKLGTSQLENRLLGGLYWTVVGTSASRGAMLLASLVLARLLGRESFGEFGAIESTIGMFAVFGNLGLSLSAIKFVAKYQYSDPAKTGRILALCYVLSFAAGLTATLGLTASAPWLAGSALGSPRLTIDLQIAALVLLLSAINGTLNGVMLGLQAFRTNGWVNVAVGVASLPILIGGALAGGIRGAIVGLVIVQAVQAVAMMAALRPVANSRGLRLVWHGCWTECGTLLSFSFAALLNSSLVAPVNWVLVLLLVRFGGGFDELGLYQVANSWFLLVLFLPGKLSQVYFPLIEDLLARNKLAEARTLVVKLVGLNSIMFAAFAMAATLCSGLILRCYGPEFLVARAALVVTVWAAVCVAATQPLTALAFAHSHVWQVTMCSLLWAAVTVLTFVELLHYGATGAAVARLVGYGVYGLLMATVALRLLDRNREQNDPSLPVRAGFKSATAGG